MIAVACVIVFVAGWAVVAVDAHGRWKADREQRQVRRIIDAARAAEAEIASEAANARRAMNDAADQSWRNLAG